MRKRRFVCTVGWSLWGCEVTNGLGMILKGFLVPTRAWWLRLHPMIPNRLPGRVTVVFEISYSDGFAKYSKVQREPVELEHA